jgi:hypothetical protein
VVDIEQAFFLSDIPQNTKCFQRLYFGAEFCFWRLPKLTEFFKALHWCHDNNVNFTLVTPVLLESNRHGLERLLAEMVPQFGSGDEILISDWGAFEMVRNISSNTTIILGRTLSGQKRGPRVGDVELSKDETDYFQRGNWYGQAAASFLYQLQIHRIELDNILQGLAALPGGLRGSLHLPYAMVTSTRNCPHRDFGDFGPCSVSCDKVFTLESAETNVPLLQAGNAQFIENREIPKNLVGLGIDRVVWHDRLPC